MIREIDAKQALHFDVSSLDHEIGMMFDGMGKDIQGMKSPVSNENGDCAWILLLPVNQSTECMEFILLSDWLNYAVSVALRKKTKKRDHMNLVITVSGLAIRGKIKIRIQRIPDKSKRRPIRNK